MKKWILGTSQWNLSGSSVNSAAPGKLQFFEVDFSGPSPVFTERALGNSVKQLVSAGINEGMTSTTDDSGNIAFYAFPNVITPYALTQDTTYLVALDSATGKDELFAKIPPAGICGNSIKETEIIKVRGVSNLYYFVYKTACINNNSNDEWRYVTVDLNTKTISLPVTLLSGSLNEGMAVSNYNCSMDNRWLFFVQYDNGNLLLYRSSITASTISAPILVTTLTIPGNNSLGQGDIEISPGSDKIAIANYTIYGIKEDVAILDLDIRTGNVSNLRWIDNPGNYIIALEFSPDGKRLYAFRGGTSSITAEMYNILIPPTGNYTISASDRLNGISIPISHSMEVGYDGKLYFAPERNNNKLYFVSNPNATAAANIISSTPGNSFGSGNGVASPLPDQINGSMSDDINLLSVLPHDTTLCAGDTITLTVTGATSVNWTGGTNSTSSSISVSPLTTTTYYLDAANFCDNLKDTITIHVEFQPIQLLSQDTTICAGQSYELKVTGAKDYEWSGGIGSTDSIVTVSPQVTTSYFLYAENQCSKLYDTVTVTVNHLPVLLNMNDIRICRGDSVTLTASGGTNYQWSGGASGSDSSITVSPFTTSTYYLNAVNFCGSLMDTVTIHVEFQPIQLLSQDTTICAGQSFVLNAIGASAYQWFGGINSTDQTITVFPLVSTSYFLKAVNNCSQLTDTVTVTVNNLPILLNIHDTTICIGKSVTLTATGGTVYQWSGGINSTDSSVTVSPSTNTIYYLHATNSCTALSDSINIHVGITPIVAHLTDTTVCEGQSVTFSVTGATNCQWSGGIISNANHLTVLPSSTTTYYLNATNQCNQLEDTITITVHNLPQVTVSGNVNICNGKSTLLTASGGKTYQWFEGSSEVTPSITVSPVITTNYSVKTFDGLCYSQITTVTVTVNPRPIVSIFGKDTICAGETGIFQAIIKDGVPPYQYKWTNGSTSSSSLFTFLTNASISVTVVDKNGCSDSSHLAISVSPQPNALLTGSISGCSPLEVEFSNQSEYAKTYYWLLGDGTISQLKNPKHTYKKPGTYTVTLIAQNNHCADTLTINDYVSVWQKPHASISYSTKNDRDFEIFNNSSFADSCILLFGDGNLLTQCDWKKTSHSYAEDGTYDLTQFVSTLKGCIDSTTIKILAQTEGTLFYPNSFTPNNDGENDIFYAYGFNIKKFNMSIYDRWGQLIFQSDDVYKGWDGTYKGRPVEQDVYVLKINYEVKKARLKTIYDHISVIK